MKPPKSKCLSRQSWQQIAGWLHNLENKQKLDKQPTIAACAAYMQVNTDLPVDEDILRNSASFESYWKGRQHKK